jgi:hypothetical protein
MCGVVKNFVAHLSSYLDADLRRGARRGEEGGEAHCRNNSGI